MVVRASLEMHSFAGLAEGLELVRGLVERFWDTVHPLLDAEDGNDPTARISALAALTHRDMLQALRGAPLIVSRQLGPVTLRALEAAAARPATKPEDAKTAASPANAPPTMATLEAAFQEVAVETLAQSCAALAQCVVQARALADSWAERLPTGGPDFTEFRRVLAQAEQAAKSRWGQRQAAAGPAAPAAPAVATPGVTASSPQTVEPPAGLTGEVRSRDDVVRAIDAICAYYGRAEPSSPLPLMLQRCRRLVPMSFTDILKELLPESIANLQKIAGKLEGGPTPKE
jgi:type VI secretion system protein ImpA